jgi:hypothetical protein
MSSCSKTKVWCSRLAVNVTRSGFLLLFSRVRSTISTVSSVLPAKGRVRGPLSLPDSSPHVFTQTATSIFSMVKNQDLRRNKLDLERLYGLLNRFGEGGGVSSTAPVRRRPDCDISQQVSPHSIDGLEPLAENPCFLNVLILRRISEDAGLHHSDPYFFSGTLTAYMAGLIEAR